MAPPAIESGRGVRHRPTAIETPQLLDRGDRRAARAPLALRRLCTAVGADAAAIWRHDRNADVLRCVAVWHRPIAPLRAFAFFSQAFTFSLGVGLPGRVWRGGRPIWISDVGRDRNFPRSRVASRAGLRSAAGWPLEHEGQLVGVVECLFGEPRQRDPAVLGELAAAAPRLGELAAGLDSGEAALASEARKASIIESALDAILLSDGEGAILEMNVAAEQLLGLPRADAIGQPLEALLGLSAVDRRGLRRLGGRSRSAPAGIRIDSTVIRPDGSRVPVEATIARVHAPGPRLLVSHVRDVRQHRELDEALRWERDFLSAVLDTVGAIVVVTDRDGRVVRFNPATEQVSGYSATELHARGTLDFLIAPESSEAVKGVVSSLQGGAARRSFENDWIRKDGSRRRILWSNTSMRATDGSLAYTIATGLDLTESRRLEQRLAQYALYDPITGLANRRLFDDRLSHALARRRGGIAVLVIGVEGFASVSSLLGHSVGDALLREVARRIGKTIPEGHSAARLGGDTFGLMLDDITGAAPARAMAARVLDAFADPFAYGTGAVSLGARVGIAVAPETSERPVAADLVRDAEIALGVARRQATGLEVFDPLAHQPAIDRREIEIGLLRALERDEFRLRYQPVVDVATGRIVGVEALLRWQHPDRGLLSPAAFLDAAEEIGLMVPISRWVLEEASREGAKWLRMVGTDAPWVSVNLSPRLFIAPELPRDVEHAIRRAGLPSANLVLEITEELAMQEGEDTAERLDRIREIGLRVAIDDFGTGYSSLSYLQRFAVDILKIDRSLVARIDDDPRQRAVMAAICDLGKALGILTLAEGIERPGQYAAARAVGCELLQGFLFSRPVAASTLGRLIRRDARLLPPGGSDPRSH